MTNGATEDLVNLNPNDIVRRILHPFADNQYAIHTSSIDELINATLQETTTNQIFNLQGYNAAVGTGQAAIGYVTAWRPTQAYRLEVVSDSNNDTENGTGARRVEIDGLDINGNQITDYVYTNAANASEPTQLEFWRVNSARVCCVGTYDGSNAGNITVRIEGAGGNVAVIQRIGTVAFGQSTTGSFTVPAGMTAQIRGVSIDVAGSQAATINLYTNQYANDVAASYQGAKTIQFIAPEITGQVDIDFRTPLLFSEFTDISFTGYSTASTTKVYINAQIALFDNVRYVAKYQKPVMPYDFVGLSESNNAALSWSAQFAADTYRIYYSETAGVSDSDSYVETTSTSYDFPQQNGTTRYYRIQGVNDSNVSKGKLSREFPVYASANPSASSVNFAGSNEHLLESAGTTTGYINGGTEASFAAWVKRDTDGIYGQVFDMYDAKLGMLWLNNNKIRIYARPGTGGAAPSTDTTLTYTGTDWYFVVGTWDLANSYHRIYVNGALAVEANVAYSTNVWDTRTGSAFFGINNNGSSFPLDGKIDHAALWTTRLLEREIVALYNAGRPVDYSQATGYYTQTSDLVGYWKLGDGDTYPTFQDSAGSADFTATNMSASDVLTTDYAGI